MFWEIFYVLNAFLEEKENSTYYGNKVITYISIKNYIQLLTNINHKRLIYFVIKCLENEHFFIQINNYKLVCPLYIY